MTEQPIIEPIPSGYRCNFPDETSLEAIDVEQDQFGRLFVTLAAIHGGRLLHRARFNLLDQGAQRDFHRGASSLNGHINWRARMVSLTDGILRVVRQPDAPPEDGDDATDPMADSWPTLHTNALWARRGVLTLAIDRLYRSRSGRGAAEYPDGFWQCCGAACTLPGRAHEARATSLRRTRWPDRKGAQGDQLVNTAACLCRHR